MDPLFEGIQGGQIRDWSADSSESANQEDVEFENYLIQNQQYYENNQNQTLYPPGTGSNGTTNAPQQILYSSINMYHKPRGSGGVWQQVGSNESIRVTAKGKHFKVVIRAAYSDCDRSETGLAQRDWDWDRDLLLKLRVSTGEVTEGFSVSKRTIDVMSNELVLRLDLLLYKVSKQMQFFAEVNTVAGRTAIYSVPFTSHAHGRGQQKISTPPPMHEEVHSSPEVFSSEVSSPSIATYPQSQSHSGNVTPEPSVSNAVPQVLHMPEFVNKKRRLNADASDERVFPPSENIYQIQGNMQVEGYVRAVGFVQFSDQRLKTNIQDLNEALAIVQALSGKRYEWRDGLVDGLRGGHKVIGLIAQDVQRVLPEAVYKTEEGYLSVAYDQLIPVLIEAIKEHVKDYEKNKAETNAEMLELKERVDKLQVNQAKQGLNEVQELKNKLDNMKVSMRNNPKYAFNAERREQVIKGCLREIIGEIDKYGLIVVLEWEFDAPECEMCVQGSGDTSAKFLFAHRQELKSLNLYGIKIVQDAEESFVGNLKLAFGYKSPGPKLALDKAQPNITIVDCRNRKNDWKQPRRTELYTDKSNEFIYTTYVSVFKELISFVKPEAINTQLFARYVPFNLVCIELTSGSQREVYISSQRHYAVRSDGHESDDEDTEEEDEESDEDDLHFKEMDHLAKLDTNPQKIAAMVDALNSNYQHRQVFEQASFTNSSQKALHTNPGTLNRASNTHVAGNANHVVVNNNQYQNYHQAPQSYTPVNNYIVSPMQSPQLPHQAPNGGYYVQNHAAPSVPNGQYLQQGPPVYYYPPGPNGAPQGYYYAPQQQPHSPQQYAPNGHSPQANRAPNNQPHSPQLAQNSQRYAYVQAMQGYQPNTQGPQYQGPAPVMGQGGQTSPNYRAPQPTSPHITAPSLRPSGPSTTAPSTGLARRVPRVVTEEIEYPLLPEEFGTDSNVDGWKKFVYNLPFKPLAGHSAFIERFGPNSVKASNAIIAPKAKQLGAGLFIVLSWRGDFNFDVSLTSVFSASSVHVVKHRGAYKNVKGTLIAKFAVLYIAAPSSDYSGEYELTFSKEVEEIAKCICVAFDVRKSNVDLEPKAVNLDEQLCTVDKKPTAYLTVDNMTLTWQKRDR